MRVTHLGSCILCLIAASFCFPLAAQSSADLAKAAADLEKSAAQNEANARRLQGTPGSSFGGGGAGGGQSQRELYLEAARVARAEAAKLRAKMNSLGSSPSPGAGSAYVNRYTNPSLQNNAQQLQQSINAIGGFAVDLLNAREQRRLQEEEAQRWREDAEREDEDIEERQRDLEERQERFRERREQEEASRMREEAERERNDLDRELERKRKDEQREPDAQKELLNRRDRFESLGELVGRTGGSNTTTSSSGGLADLLTASSRLPAAAEMDQATWHALSLKGLEASGSAAGHRDAASKLEQGLAELDAPRQEGVDNAVLSAIGAGGKALVAGSDVAFELAPPSAQYGYKTARAVMDLANAKNAGERLASGTKALGAAPQVTSDIAIERLKQAKQVGILGDGVNAVANIKKGGYEGTTGAAKDGLSIAKGLAEGARTQNALGKLKVGAAALKAAPQAFEGAKGVYDAAKTIQSLNEQTATLQDSLADKALEHRSQAALKEQEAAYYRSILLPNDK